MVKKNIYNLMVKTPIITIIVIVVFAFLSFVIIDNLIGLNNILNYFKN